MILVVGLFGQLETNVFSKVLNAKGSLSIDESVLGFNSGGFCPIKRNKVVRSRGPLEWIPPPPGV